ncbi:hypothetical protein BJ322DRAFT_1092718 [Thelephora terrestris]|uniref:DUF7770 domain-containing protein n=1 Tax=Thelephora terrestris TaxID=56493 RepID=A0A9P6H2Y5_9AGAM|nr:hypothetical protein BJ322DRAFT_1092718 [Thelephora terrestris]
MSLKSYILNNKNWGKSRFTFDHLKSPVARIHFVAHENVLDERDNPGERPTNHWTLFFTISDNLSVHVDAVPNEPGRPGMIIPESENSAFAADAIHVASTNVPSGLTVEDLLGIIVDRRRDHYTFAPIGEGCRYWLSVISKDFIEAGVICEQESDAVIEALGMYWPSPSGSLSVPRPMARGTFHA